MNTKHLQTMRQDRLLSSSLYLMLSMGAVSVTGFIFWIIVARMFDTATVGLATTLLSMSMFVSLFGLIGFDTIFARFFARADNRNELINTGLLVNAIITGIMSVIFCLITPYISPSIAFVAESPINILAFTVFTIFTSWNTLTTAILVANHNSRPVLVINILFSLAKLALPFIIGGDDPMVIFIIVGIAQVINVALSLWVIITRTGYRPSFKISGKVLKQTYRYGFATYIASLLNLAPDSLLPIIVVNEIGPSAAAYFYIAFTIASLLYTIAFSTVQAIMAEATHDEENMMHHLKRGIKIVMAITVPSIVAIIAVAPLVLSAFGPDYREGSYLLVCLLSVSGIAVSLYAAIGAYFKLTKNLFLLLVAPIVNAISVIVLCWILAKPFGLLGVGWGWLIGSFLAVIAGGIMFVIHRRHIVHKERQVA